MRTSSSLLIALTLACSSSSAVADDSAPSPSMQAIKRNIGNWSGKGSITSDGKTHDVKMTWRCVDAAAGAGVRCHGEITGLPDFTYVLDDLWGYSQADGLVHWYTITNAGEVHDHRGHFDAGGGQLSADLAMDGKVFSEVISFSRKADALSLTWVTTLGGAERERGKLRLTLSSK
jgi:hypothetical protein